MSQGALAQEAVSSTVDGTTISVGGGIQFLWLPDIKFTGAGKPSNFHFQTNSEFTEYGPAADAKIETQLGYWGGYRVTGSLRGFWSNLDDSDGRSCKGGCVVVDPSTGFVANGSSLFTHTDRDVDYWGGSLEAKFWGRDPVQVRPNLLRTDYLLIGYAASTRATT
jgi:hypothetical protein